MHNYSVYVSADLDGPALLALLREKLAGIGVEVHDLEEAEEDWS